MQTKQTSITATAPTTAGHKWESPDHGFLCAICGDSLDAHKPDITLAAKQLMTGDVIAIGKTGEIILSIVRRDNHVYVETDYTKQTGAGAYDLDKMQSVKVLATLGGKGKLA